MFDVTPEMGNALMFFVIYIIYVLTLIFGRKIRNQLRKMRGEPELVEAGESNFREITRARTQDLDSALTRGTSADAVLRGEDKGI